MAYSGKYTSWTREDILTEVKSKMKVQRFEHVLRVEKSALELARRYNGDLEACSLAALLHDYAKELPKETMDSIVQTEQWNPEILQYGSQIWHGPAGAYFAEKKFGIIDDTILAAIRDHTIGNEKMSLTGKILFVADYIESGRTFPGVQTARTVAMESLDQAAMFKITQTIIHLVEKGLIVYPETLTVYNAWVRKKEEIY